MHFLFCFFFNSTQYLLAQSRSMNLFQPTRYNYTLVYTVRENRKCLLTGKLLLEVRVPSHRYGHFFPPVLFVHQQHVQHVIDTEQRVHPVIAVKYLLEIDYSTALFGKFIYQVHHLKTTTCECNKYECIQNIIGLSEHFDNSFKTIRIQFVFLTNALQTLRRVTTYIREKRSRTVF